MEEKPRIRVRLAEKKELGWLKSDIEYAISCDYEVEKYLQRYEVYDEHDDKYVELDWWFDGFMLFAAGNDYKNNLHIIAAFCYDTGWCELSEFIFTPESE